MVSAQTMTSPARESRADSSDGSRGPSPALKIYNPEAKASPETKTPASPEAKTQLHVVGKDEERTPAPIIKTIEQAHKESTLTLNDVMYGLRKALSLGAAAFCAAAAVAVKVLPEHSFIRTLVERLASTLSRLSIGIVSGVTGMVDASKSGKPLLAAAQLGDVLTSLLAPITEMTNYRGVSIGLYNMLPALETMHGRVTYTGVQDYLQTNWTALKSMVMQIMKDPSSLLSKKGPLGVLSGGVMSITSLLYLLTGWKPFATVRNMVGIPVEAEKLKPQHLAEGRGRYAASGALMMGGSAANIISQYAGSNSQFWSYINLLLNATGKERFMAALQTNEPAKVSAPLTIMDVVSKNLNNMFSFAREADKLIAKAAPVILKTEQQSPVVQKQAQQVAQRQASNGINSSGLGSSSSRFTRSVGLNTRTVAPVMKQAASVSTPIKVEAAPAKVEVSAPVSTATEPRGEVKLRPIPSVHTPAVELKPTTPSLLPSVRLKGLPRPIAIPAANKKAS